VSLALALGLIAHTANSTPGGKATRVIIYPGADDSVAQFQKDGATKVEDCGAYWLAEVPEGQLATLQQAHKGKIQDAQRLNKIELNETQIDVTAGAPAVPAQLQEAAGQERSLRIVQFKGPVLPQWLAQLKAIAGVQILNSIPNNAYLVSVHKDALAKVLALRGGDGPVQWVGAYHPYYKLPKGLREATGVIEVRISVLNPDHVSVLRRFAAGPVEAHPTAVGQTLATMQVNAADLPAIAQSSEVVWIQAALKIQKQDEAQALVIAGRTNAVGYALLGASYLDFLGGGSGSGWIFSTDPADYPALDICDTGVDTPRPYTPPRFFRIFDSFETFHPSFNQYYDPFTGFLTDAAISNLACNIFPENFVINRKITINDGLVTDTDGHGTRIASIAVGFDILPDEIIHCEIETYPTVTESGCCVYCIDSLPTTGVQCPGIQFGCDVPTGATVSAPVRVGSCPSQDGGTADRVQITWTRTVETCVRVVDSDTPPPPWALTRQDGSGFQLGLGVSPFGRFTVSSMDAAKLNPEASAQRVYLGRARLSNNSWSEALVTGVNDGGYNALSQSYDALTRDALATGVTNSPGAGRNQEMLFIFANGNDNGSQPDNGGFGDVLVTPPATAKNVLSVGATNLRVGGSPNELSVFSSFGPTQDGRFKPDVVAPGAGVAGAVSQGTYDHTECAGCDFNFIPEYVPVNPLAVNRACTPAYSAFPTISRLYNNQASAVGLFTLWGSVNTPADGVSSYAAPAVSGAAQLLWAYFQEPLLQLPPSPAMLKGYIMNSARYLPITNPLYGTPDKLPSIAQGMGMIDLNRMFDGVPRVLRDESTARAIDSPLYATNVVAQQTYFSSVGQTYEVTGTVAVATQPFRVTLVWTDAPGTPGNGRQLVNDLDLQVTVNGVTYYGNDFNTQFSRGNNPNAQADNLNNVETVSLPPPGALVPWSVLVRATDIAGDGVPNVGGALDQDYALVIYNAENASDLPTMTTNDTCQTAAGITTFPYAWTNNLAAGVYHNNHPSPTTGRGGDEEFFVITYPTPGTVFTANTVGSASGLVPILSVWKGDCGGLVEVTSARSNTNTFQAGVSWTVTDTNIYYIVVEGFQNRHGQLVLNVNATPPPFGFSAALVDFGSQYIGAGTNITVTLNNNTGSAAIISAESITGPDASSFSILVENCLDQPLPNGSSCELTLRFSPTTTGELNATLNLTNNITGSPHKLNLTGTGLTQVPLFCSDVVKTSEYGIVNIGTSTVHSIVITNCGTADMFITNAVLSGATGDFVIVSAPCTNSTIAPNTSCAIGVRFAPLTSGRLTAKLTINNNTENGPHTVDLGGTGKTPAPLLFLTPLTLTFDTGPVGATSGVKKVTIKNIGDAPLTNFTISLTGDAYILLPGACSGAILATGQSCEVSVRFAPSVLGATSGSIQFVDNDTSGSPHTVALSGIGSGSQADGLISRKRKSKKARDFVGNDIYNTDGAGQEVVQKGKRGKVKRFYVTVQNDGNVTDAFRVLGSEDLPGAYTVRYFLGGKGGMDITAAVKAGTFMTSSLAVGATTSDTTLIRVEVTADVAGSAGARSVLVTFTSTGNDTKLDAVKATITVK